MQNKNTKKLWLFLLLIVASVFIFQNTPTSWAIYDTGCEKYSGSEYQDCLRKKRETAEAMIKIKRQQEITLNNQLQVIDLEQAKNEEDLDATHENLQTLGEQIAELQKNIQEKEDQIKYQTSVLNNLMRSYYENDQQGILEIVLLQQSLSNILNQLDYMGQTSLKVSDVLSEIKDIKEGLKSNQNELQTKKDESEQLKSDLEQKYLNLQYTESKKQTLLVQTQEEKEKYKQLLDDIEKEIYDLESNKSVDYSDLPPAKGGYFDYPVSSPVITQGYGCLQTAFARESYPPCNNRKGGFHNGLDFGSASGSSIFSVRDGKVVASGTCYINGRWYAYGRWIAIDHGDGLVTLYGHLSAKYVSKGDKVDEGEKIGKMGSTGYSTGTHLHFSVFDKKSFETTESKYVKGLMIPTGASISPKRYLK